MITMRRLLYVLLILFATAGCDKWPENGDLDGMWQFLTVTYHTAGGDSAVIVKDGQAYLSFQLDLAQIKAVNMELDSATSTILARFNHSDGKLTLYDFYRHYRTADSLFTDADSLLLTPLGIRGTSCTFDVASLSSESMELESDYADITFRKF